MPRKARIDAPGAIHHIIIRGIEKKPIFKDEQDYCHFLERLGNILNETSTPCFAWALMHNHVHLLLRTGSYPLSTVMRRLLTGYAQFFNRRHKRHGYLLQNRYKSILCEEEPYLLELVRYIHLNPIRSGTIQDIKSLAKYPLTGHAVIMGNIKHNWQDIDYVLEIFNKRIRVARKSYTTFVSKGIDMGRRQDLIGGGLIRSVGGWSELKKMKNTGERIMSDERILGSSDFVEYVLKNADEHLEKKTKALASGINIDDIIDQVAVNLNIDPFLMGSKSRKRMVVKARSLACAISLDDFLIKGSDMAKRLNMSRSAVSKLANRGRKDPQLEKIRDKLFGG